MLGISCQALQLSCEWQRPLKCRIAEAQARAHPMAALSVVRR